MAENHSLALVIRKTKSWDLFQENFNGKIRMAPDCSWLEEKLNRAATVGAKEIYI